MTLLEQVKTLSGQTDEALIDLVIRKTIAEIELLTGEKYYKDDLGMGAELAFEDGLESGTPTKFDNICVDMAIFKLNRRHNEGLSSMSANGMSENYMDTYPKHIRDQLQKFKKNVRFF